MLRVLLICGILLSTAFLCAQSYAVSVKGGAVMAFQQWSNIDRSPLFAYQGRIGIETAEDDENYSLYSELGFHQRGSALRNTFFTNINTQNIFRLPTQKYLFNNVALVVGAKSKKRINDKTQGFYGLGIRGEYTVSTNLGEYESIVEEQYGGLPIFPIEEFVQKWNYGIDVTGGIEYQLSDYVNGIIELRVSPDFSPQYLQPEISRVSGGQNNRLNEQRVVNVSIELSVGLRFLRKIVYID